MLETVKHFLKSTNKLIVLASASPRRKEILEKNLGLEIKVIASSFAEDLDKRNFKTPVDYVVENSRLKAIDVSKNTMIGDWFLIIGADTIVEMDNIIYEKPLDKEDAFNMLKKLSSKTHKVSTGVTLIKKDDNQKVTVHSFSETSEVTMATLDDETIRGYVETGEPLDKAGGYGIQGLGCSLIKSIKGDYFNVMGFPAHKFAIEFKTMLNPANESKTAETTYQIEMNYEDEFSSHGGFVVPLPYCPHLEQINKKLDKKLVDARRACTKCNDPKENWICLTCFDTCCSRYVNEHMVLHSLETKHPMALSFSDISVWCYECENYVDNEILAEVKDMIYKTKFE